MKTLILRIQYDGTDYGGWQIQPNADSIQARLQSALGKISGFEFPVIGAGRTDAGVHARGMVAHAKVDDSFPVPEAKIPNAFNANLPPEIRVDAAKLTDSDFNARFDAIAREYSYGIYFIESPFLRRFAHYVKYPIDPGALDRCAEVFVGEHDFTTFSKLNPDTKNYVCKVEFCRWRRKDETYEMQIKADRFVYGAVRHVVGACLDAARGKRSPEQIAEALAARDRKFTSPQAPANGLILEKVYYREEIFE